MKFGEPQQWSSFFCLKGEVCLIADVNADGKADAIAFNHGLNEANAVFVGLSNGAAFAPATKAHNFFCTKTQTCAVGDVNGDFKADLIAFTRGTTPRVFVALSNGTSFGAPQLWSSSFCRTGDVCKVADVNGDVFADLVAFRHRPFGTTNGVFVARSNGSSFGTESAVDDRLLLLHRNVRGRRRRWQRVRGYPRLYPRPEQGCLCGVVEEHEVRPSRAVELEFLPNRSGLSGGGCQ